MTCWDTNTTHNQHWSGTHRHNDWNPELGETYLKQLVIREEIAIG